MRWESDALLLLDQTRLPREEEWLTCRRPEEVADAIRRLSVRGAPAIGVAAAYGLALGLRETGEETGDGADGMDAAALDRRFEEVFELLAGTRPTAVNLRWALDQGRQVYGAHRGRGRGAVADELLALARRLHAEDVETNRRIGEHGAALFGEGDRVLTHCNAGALATAGFGTAVGVITAGYEHGRVGMVWVDETRPLLQGARLTAWELSRLGIPFRVVTDSSAGSLLSRDLVDRIVVGADRIAANGDVANKIGTYPLAVLANRHRVPFYVAAPLSTVDPACPTGEEIPIEERAAGEVTDVFGVRVAPEAADAYNPAFDVTPSDLVTAIVTEVGVLEAPYEESLHKALVGAGVVQEEE